MYSLIHKVYAASGEESDPKRLKWSRLREQGEAALRFMQESAFSVTRERVFSAVVNWMAGSDVVAGNSRPSHPDAQWRSVQSD
jgi:hypothetical protein